MSCSDEIRLICAYAFRNDDYETKSRVGHVLDSHGIKTVDDIIKRKEEFESNSFPGLLDMRSQCSLWMFCIWFEIYMAKHADDGNHKWRNAMFFDYALETSKHLDDWYAGSACQAEEEEERWPE